MACVEKLGWFQEKEGGPVKRVKWLCLRLCWKVRDEPIFPNTSLALALTPDTTRGRRGERGMGVAGWIAGRVVNVIFSLDHSKEVWRYLARRLRVAQEFTAFLACCNVRHHSHSGVLYTLNWRKA